MFETSTNNATKTPFIMKTYKLPHIIQNKPQPEMIDMLVEFYIKKSNQMLNSCLHFLN